MSRVRYIDDLFVCEKWTKIIVNESSNTCAKALTLGKKLSNLYLVRKLVKNTEFISKKRKSGLPETFYCAGKN
jgi:hypothetical protein